MAITIPESGSAVLETSLKVLSNLLLNPKTPLSEKFRVLFDMRAADSDEAVQMIGKAFNDSSALFKHEVAYVLGQMRRESAIPILSSVLSDLKQEAIVRHEAAEALGAIGSKEALPILRTYLNDDWEAVRETCEIAIGLIEHPEQTEEPIHNVESELSFSSIDPAPALKSKKTISELQKQLMDTSLDLYRRYKVMFALRNRGTEEAIMALCTGFTDKSALFRHEIAYVLGQLQHPASIPILAKQIYDADEVPIVRHECIEALGSIATPECLAIIREFENDPSDVVRESCIVARGMYEYENSSEF